VLHVGPLLLTPAHPSVVAFAAELPWELAVVLSVLRCATETGALLGSLTLGLQLIVLGASLLPSKSLQTASGETLITPLHSHHSCVYGASVLV
jgi:hypothetical protein